MYTHKSNWKHVCLIIQTKISRWVPKGRVKTGKFRISILMEANSRAVKMAPGPNATHYGNIKELISLWNTCKGRRIWKRPAQACVYQQLLFHISVWSSHFIKSSGKGQVGWVLSERLSYFVTQTEKLDNIHCISKDWNTLMSRCWFPVGWYQSFGQWSFTWCYANSQLTPSMPEYLRKPTLNYVPLQGETRTCANG